VTVPAKCPKCKLEHDPVDVVRWLWLFRDTKPKPPGKGGLILAMLAARMDAKTGCGWTTDPDLAELGEVADAATVRAATRWGRDRLLLHRAVKGYRITDERGEKSLWILTDPHRPTGNRLPHGKASQPGTGSPMAAEPTGNLSGANRESEPDPTGSPSPSIAKPTKLNQEAKSSARTHDPKAKRTRTGARRVAGDPRLILAGLGADEETTNYILASIEADPGIGDPARHLLTIVGNGGGPRLVADARRQLAAAKRARHRPADDDFEAERRRQQDGLTQWMRDHPAEGAP
jgi:hypothetical protein